MDPSTNRTWGAFILTGVVCLLFAISLYFVFRQNDQNLLIMMIGAIVAKFSDIVSYWTGSSASSREKDAALTEKASQPVVRIP